MARYAVAVIVALLSSSGAQAQASRAYRCTYDPSGSYVSIMFGPDELRYRSNSAGGGWGENICDEMSDCRFMGQAYIAEGYDFFFTYNSDTGRFSFDDYASETRTLEGTCSPE